jgi:hypothetical protein
LYFKEKIYLIPALMLNIIIKYFYELIKYKPTEHGPVGYIYIVLMDRGPFGMDNSPPPVRDAYFGDDGWLL